ncbi:MAG: bacteriohemerythrin [Thermodesulfovibrionales bacterium]|jgi:hemerythrin|nr:bacteriohemerythrin [Thermodesulfovibrionales bacterium]
MALFVWSDKYSVNINEIDSQHKKLVDMLNSLHDSMKAGKGNEVLGKTLTELIQYVGTHFATEERLLSTHGYPELNVHKSEHAKLTQKAIELQKDFQQGAPVLTVEVLGFLKDWLQNHILGTDKKYSQFLNSKGVV